MKTETFFLRGIPAVLYGENAGSVYVFVHGKMGCKADAEGFAEVVCPRGFQVVSIDLPGHGERTAEAERFVPWEVTPELGALADFARNRWEKISLCATSLGAYFSLLAFGDLKLEKSLFLSPILDMVRLIEDMMGWAGVTREQLRLEGEIPTSFGETLSWRYLTYAREHPITRWSCPTAILWGDRDHLTSRETAEAFAKRFGCRLTVMEDGEHWFHTQEQLAVLDAWLHREAREKEGVQ